MNEVFDSYAAYYDMFNSEKDYAGEVDIILDYLCKKGVSSGSILELGCGSGGHAFELSDRGFDVVGADLSEQMLAVAHQKARQATGPTPKFIPGDVRTLRLEQKFNIVLSLFHVVSYQTTDKDLAETIETAARHLKPRGVLLFDFWYGPAVLWQKPERRIRRFSGDGISAERLAEPEHVPSENRVCVKFTITLKGEAISQPMEIVEEHNMRYFFEPELVKSLENAFEEIEIFAWETRSPPGKDDWTAVAVARRK